MATKAKNTGVYMRLLHGRLDPDERDRKDWGFDGPVLGPFVAVHFTHGSHIRCIINPAKGEEIELGFYDGCLLVYDDKYYGDFEIVSAPSS